MAGRPTKRTPEIDTKIEEAAALGASIEEIAYYAGVHRNSLRNWMAADPELLDRITELQERPILKARQTIVKALEDPEHARWYVERKKKAEFSTRSEITGADGKGVMDTTKEIKDVTDKLNALFSDSSLPSDGNETIVVDTQTPDTN